MSSQFVKLSGTTGGGGGGGGTPGGSPGDIQYNSSGAFGGNNQFTYTLATNTLQLGTGSTTFLINQGNSGTTGPVIRQIGPVVDAFNISGDGSANFAGGFTSFDADGDGEFYGFVQANTFNNSNNNWSVDSSGNMTVGGNVNISYGTLSVDQINDANGNELFETNSGYMWPGANTILFDYSGNMYSQYADIIYNSSNGAFTDLYGASSFIPSARTLTDNEASAQIGWSTTGVTIYSKINSYNGASTVGNGAVVVLGGSSNTAETASISATTIITTPSGSNSMWKASGYIYTSTSGSGNTVTLSLKWTDPTSTTQTVTTSTVNLASLGNYQTINQVFVSKGSQNIQFLTTVGTIGTSKYDYYIYLERIS